MESQTPTLDTLFLEKEEDLKWHQKIERFIFLGAVGIVMVVFVNKMIGKAKSSHNATMRRKLKYFNPTINEGIFFNTVTWTGREKPLTDEDVEKLM